MKACRLMMLHRSHQRRLRSIIQVNNEQPYEALLLVALVVLCLNTRLLVRWVRGSIFPGRLSIFEIYFSGLYTDRQAVLAMRCTVATNCDRITQCS